MKRDAERIQRVQQALEKAKLDAVICTLPTHVLLVSGYWPVIGNSAALATRYGKIILVVPEDEESLAQSGWADEIHTFSNGSLHEIRSTSERIRTPLLEVTTKLQLFDEGAVGYESREDYQPASYVSTHLFLPELNALLKEIFYGAKLVPAGDLFARLLAVLTPGEIQRVRSACKIAERAFLRGAKRLRAGLKETQAANLFRAPLTELPRNVQRADGFVYCMSGENSFEAYASFQRSRSRKIANGDLVLIHCNSYADGFWTDITRTFCIGEPDEQKQRRFDAVFAAREAALGIVRPGIKASAVDHAAREQMKEHGFEKEFRHPTGHGVGFLAINHEARPRIHPKSEDILEPGMVFNLEPGIYIQGLGGMRHCDMVLVTENDAENLTPFQSSLADLIVLEKELALL